MIHSINIGDYEIKIYNIAGLMWLLISITNLNSAHEQLYNINKCDLNINDITVNDFPLKIILAIMKNYNSVYIKDVMQAYKKSMRKQKILSLL